MQSILDRYLGIEPAALVLEGERTNVLAANLANADTPGYKARDVDFKAALAAAASATGQAPTGGTLALTPAGRDELAALSLSQALSSTPAGAAAQGAPGGPDAFLKYRVPLAPALDGNTVDGQLEEAAFAENGVRYQATLTFLNTKLRDLLVAIGSS